MDQRQKKIGVGSTARPLLLQHLFSMTELEKYISTYFSATKEEVEQISNAFQPLELKKGDYFLHAGRLSDRLGFIQSGILREYLIIDDREVTKWISTAGYFAVDIASFHFLQPSRWNIQALSDCEMYVLDKKSHDKLGQELDRWETLEKLFIAKCFAALENRVVQHIALSASERYQQLCEFAPELFNLVPQQYLASMLGITAETLSRLRRAAIK